MSLTVTEAFNGYLQKIEDFNLTFSFFGKKIKVGFHDRTTTFYRWSAFVGCIVLSVFWFVTGYETTIMRLVTNELPTGVGIHWGTLLFTLGSFLICSFLLERIGVTKIRNALYSAILATGFINGLFEVTYTILYDIIHHGTMWINAPFLYNNLGIFRLYPTYRNYFWVFSGAIFLLMIKRYYGFKWRNPFKNKVLYGFFATLVFCWIFWIFYPIQFMQVRSSFFPQYLYGFREFETIPDWIPEENIITLLETDWKAVYTPNLGVRITNEITKFFHFIFFTYMFIPHLNRVENLENLEKKEN